MAKNNTPLYRLTLSDDASHKRIRLWRFSKLGAIASVIVAAVVLYGIFYALIAFTPLKTTIPGYPDAHFKRGAIANALKVDSLENEMLRWTLYAENLSRVLSGEEGISGTDSLIAGSPRHLEGIAAAELARRDSVLRGIVAREERFGVGVSGTRTLPIEGMHFFTPLKGTVSQAYDVVLHPALDITAPAGTVVSAVLDGTVISAGWTTTGGGNVIKIKHNSTYTTGYLHLKGFAKGIKAGKRVSQGQVIGYVGSTGTSTGPHLDLRVWKNGTPIDPLAMKSPAADPLPAKYKPELDSLYNHYKGIFEGTAN